MPVRMEKKRFGAEMTARVKDSSVAAGEGQLRESMKRYRIVVVSFF